MTEHRTAEDPTFGRDTRAAYTGLILGAIVILLILGTIVKLTNAKYAHETPSAESR
jgi:hypothetical protein